MCSIVFAWQWSTEASFVLVANRDESTSRPSDTPALLQENPRLWGGRDRLAGGTWLAVDPRGRVCAVTNRHPHGRPPARDPERRSRGGLPTELLNAGDDTNVVRAMAQLRPSEYNPVNVVYLSGTSAAWVALDDESGRRGGMLAPGVHVITEQDPDDGSSVKASSLLSAAREVADAAEDVATLTAGLRSMLRSHERAGDGPETAACIHEVEFGTVSSASVVVTPEAVHFEHAEGHPCVTPYTTVLSTARGNS
jgi:uncharacterized protein with NRDE domain